MLWRYTASMLGLDFLGVLFVRVGLFVSGCFVADFFVVILDFFFFFLFNKRIYLKPTVELSWSAPLEVVLKYQPWCCAFRIQPPWFQLLLTNVPVFFLTCLSPSTHAHTLFFKTISPCQTLVIYLAHNYSSCFLPEILPSCFLSLLLIFYSIPSLPPAFQKPVMGAVI